MSNPIRNADQPWGAEQIPFETPSETTAAEAATAVAASVPEQVVPAPLPPHPFPTATPASSSQTQASSGAAAAADGWGSVKGVYAGVPPAPVPAISQPSPAAAFWLGLIPGVGAMYNGQVVKGFLHLLVFMVLVTIAGRIGIFGIAIAGWILFMAFEAYHTAKARRDGQPLPDPFGWNDVGERVGLGKGWPFHTSAPVAPAVTPIPLSGPSAAASGIPASAVRTPMPPFTPPTASVTPNWAGYVAPEAFASPPPFAPYSGSSTPGQAIPYTPVQTGLPYVPQPVPDVSTAGSRLPVGAIWLIGLGVLFLVGQWIPVLQFSRVWVPSLVLAGVAALLFARRMGLTSQPLDSSIAALPPLLRGATAIRVPGALLAVAVLNVLNAADIAHWNRSWPWLLIVLGGLLLMERVALRKAAHSAAARDGQAAGDPVA